MRAALVLAAVVLVIAQAGVAQADRGELRLSLLGDLPAFVDMQQSGGDTSGSLVWATRVRGAYGVSDYLEVGGDVGFSTTSAAHFSNATVSNVPGDLYADLYAFEAAPGVRLVGPAFVHAGSTALLRPALDVRGGLLVRTLSSQLALDDRQRRIPGLASSDTAFLPFLGITGGLEWRFADTYAVGLAGEYVYGGSSYNGLGIAVELSLLRFP